jgi:hypothetical protein
MVQGAHIQGMGVARYNGSAAAAGIVVACVNSAVVAVDERHVPHIQAVSHGPIYKLILQAEGTHTFKGSSMGGKVLIVPIVMVAPDPVTGGIASGLP